MIFKIDPIGKPRMTQSDRWKSRPCVLKYWHFKDELKRQMIKARFLPQEVLSITFVMPMPKSWSKKKKREYDGQPHRQKPDLDNVLKAYQDSLYVEDSNIHTYKEVRKIWGYEGKIIIH